MRVVACWLCVSIGIVGCGSGAAPSPAQSFCTSFAGAVSRCGGSSCEATLAGDCTSVAGLFDDSFLSAADSCLASGSSPGACFGSALGALSPTDAQHQLAASFCSQCLGGLPGCVDGFFASPAGLAIRPFSSSLLTEVEAQCVQGPGCGTSFAGCLQELLTSHSLSAETAQCLVAELTTPSSAVCSMPDAGPAPIDAGPAPMDAGPAPMDAGHDAGHPAMRDSGTPDAGMPAPIVVDPAFGSGGVVRIPAGVSRDWVMNDCAVDSDGSVVMGGSSLSTPGALFVRLTSAGALDPSFGTGGVVLRSYDAGSDRVASVALTSDGRIAAALGGNVIVRLAHDGSQDSSFDGDGIVLLRIGLLQIILDAVEVDGGDRIVVGGSSSETFVTGPTDYLVGRIDGSGAFDSSFDGDGLAIYSRTWGTPSLRDEYIHTLAIDSSNRVIGNGTGIALRFTAGGALDSSFGIGGVLSMDGSSAVQTHPRPDSTLIEAWDAPLRSRLSHLMTSGAVDPAYGSGGYAEVCAGSQLGSSVSMPGGETWLMCADNGFEAYDAGGAARGGRVALPSIAVASGSARLTLEAFCSGPSGAVAVGAWQDTPSERGLFAVRFVNR